MHDIHLDQRLFISKAISEPQTASGTESCSVLGIFATIVFTKPNNKLFMNGKNLVIQGAAPRVKQKSLTIGKSSIRENKLERRSGKPGA